MVAAVTDQWVELGLAESPGIEIAEPKIRTEVFQICLGLAASRTSGWVPEADVHAR